MKKYRVTYLYCYEEKGEWKTKDLGHRDLVLWNDNVCKEAVAFRRATVEQLKANRLNFREL